MVSWSLLEFVLATLLIFQFAWFECRNAADPMGADNDAAVKFDCFADDSRGALGRDGAGVMLLPRWKAFRYVSQGALEAPCGASRAYALDFVAIGADGREIRLSEAHPSWDALNALAAARELSLFSTEGRVWAQYSA